MASDPQIYHLNGVGQAHQSIKPVLMEAPQVMGGPNSTNYVSI